MDFLNDVKYSLSEKVFGLINQAYNKLDSENAGAVSLDTMSQNYNAKQHPHVLSRRKSPQEVMGIFVNGMARKAEGDAVKR